MCVLMFFQITKLKIASNPFAKGFRESTRSRDHHHHPATFNPAAITAFYGPAPFAAPPGGGGQFIHPRQLLEANQQLQMATQHLQMLAPVIHQTMRYHQQQQQQHPETSSWPTTPSTQLR